VFDPLDDKLTVRLNLAVNPELRSVVRMNANPTIMAERVDDIPLLPEHMRRMGLPALFDYHFPTHCNWKSSP
jgi:hypothetical protein